MKHGHSFPDVLTACPKCAAAVTPTRTIQDRYERRMVQAFFCLACQWYFQGAAP